MTLKNALRIALVMAIVFCLWGLWDVSLWVSLYPALDYTLPFRLFAMPWFLAGDLFVVVAAACTFVLALIGGDS